MPRQVPPPYSRVILLACLAGIDLLPYLASWIRDHGKLPVEYGTFPPVPPPTSPPAFNLGCFIGYSLVAAAIAGLFLFPRLYGFKRPPAIAVLTLAHGRFPHWFWSGLVFGLLGWYLMWFGSVDWARFSFAVVWFSFLYFLDGLVYARIGTSIVARRGTELLTLAVVSIFGWYLFEYLSYFFAEAWIYPYGTRLLTQFGITAFYSLSFATVWPAVFEWYMLLASFPTLRLRWDFGPKLHAPRWVMALVGACGIGLSVAMVFYPYPLFWAMWAAPAMILLAGLELAGFWTPLEPARRGHWSRFNLMALAAFCNGIFWEFWNYGSDLFHRAGGQIVHTNPNYWYYRIPYISVLYPFSRMPLLGYFGYFALGIICWALWLTVAHLTGLNPDFAMEDILVAHGLQPAADSQGPSPGHRREA